MTELALSKHQYLELEKLGLGAFYPLDGFMNEEQFRGVVETMRLPGGEPFPIPVFLDLSQAQAKRVKGRPKVQLIFAGEEVGVLHPQDVFSCDKPAMARQVYGTDDPAHPGVRFFLGMGEMFVGGSVTLTKRAQFDISADELTPEDTRRIFAQRGWKTIVGFQTRNVPHRAHEYLHRVALERADGLFVQPLIGRRKIGDYTPQAVMGGYRALLENFYPMDRVLLGILSTTMRYAGPREAVFHAIVRRNYGCTHFIVGRDHAGVGAYYGKYAAHELTRQFDGELGIEIMRMNGPYYCRKCEQIVTESTCRHAACDPSAVIEISGTEMRAMLSGESEPLPHLMRTEVIEALRGTKLFIDEEER